MKKIVFLFMCMCLCACTTYKKVKTDTDNVVKIETSTTTETSTTLRIDTTSWDNTKVTHTIVEFEHDTISQRDTSYVGEINISGINIRTNGQRVKLIEQTTYERETGDSSSIQAKDTTTIHNDANINEKSITKQTQITERMSVEQYVAIGITALVLIIMVGVWCFKKLKK